MSLKLLFYGFFIFLVASGAALGQQTSRAKSETDLINLIGRLTDAQARFEPAVLEKILADDYIEISPRGEVDTREKVIGFYSPAEKDKTAGVAVTVVNDEFLIRTNGAIAIVIARLDYRMKKGDATFSKMVRAVFVCRSEKGVWKIASSQFTPIR